MSMLFLGISIGAVVGVAIGVPIGGLVGVFCNAAANARDEMAPEQISPLGEILKRADGQEEKKK
jgi:hypothetical protein